MFYTMLFLLQLEWIVLDCHYSLLEILVNEKNRDEELIAQRCGYLLSIARNVTIPRSDELLQLQEKVSAAQTIPLPAVRPSRESPTLVQPNTTM